jgi:hypothetical protein
MHRPGRLGSRTTPRCSEQDRAADSSIVPDCLSISRCFYPEWWADELLLGIAPLILPVFVTNLDFDFR